MSAEQHNPLCDCLDINPDGIRKPCNCGAELSVDDWRRLRDIARECIRNSGGDPDAEPNDQAEGARPDAGRSYPPALGSASDGVWWCNAHQRLATHTDANGRHFCDPALGGILLPCHAVFKPNSAMCLSKVITADHELDLGIKQEV